MTVFRNQLLKSFLAASLLVAWAGSYHHDTWLALGDVDHYHQHEHVHVNVHDPVSDADHGHTPSPSGEKDHHKDSVPLADTHSTVAVVVAKKISISAPVFVGDFIASALSLSGAFAPLVFNGSEDSAPGVAWPGLVPLRHLILADRVQANAPPVTA